MIAPGPQLLPGQVVAVRRWRAHCPATVLAVLDGEALVEYETPDRSALVFCSRWQSGKGPLPVHGLRRNPYGYRLPIKWLEAVIAVGSSWIGRSADGWVPSPSTLLEQIRLPASQEGWEQLSVGEWVKSYKGHRLRIRKVDGTVRGFVGLVPALTAPEGRAGAGWKRVAAAAHDLAQVIGPAASLGDVNGDLGRRFRDLADGQKNPTM